MKKKIIATILAGAMLLSGSAFAYPDIKNNLAVDYVTRMGIVEGYPDGTFRPNSLITREEMGKIFHQYFLIHTPGYRGDIIEFSDIERDRWSYPYISSLSRYWIIDGYPDGTFKPLNNITREEFTKMLAVACNHITQSNYSIFEKSEFADVKGRWSEAEIAFVYEFLFEYNPHVSKDGLFHPTEDLTRLEVAETFFKFEKSIREVLKDRNLY